MCDVGCLFRCCDEPQKFQEKMLISMSKKSCFDVQETIQSLSKEDVDRFLSSFEKLVQNSVVDIDSDFKRIHVCLHVLNILVDLDIKLSKTIKILSLVHDHLLQFSDKNSFVQNFCCQVLEKCWTRNINGRKDFAINVPLYLLARCLCPIGRLGDVNRLNDIRDMLELIDFRCASSASLLSLLCLAAANKLFFRNRQGIEFLSYILTLDEEVMLVINQTIKDFIPDLKDTQLVNAGKVFYEAADLAKEKGLLQVYEKDCLQGLMFCALHCHRVGPNKASINFYKVLSVLHKQKKGYLRDILYQLYKPLISRSLDAANGHVRANAAALFLDLFPYISSNFTKVESQDAFEEQCTKIKELLMDDHELVRVVAAKGCAQILSDHWKDMPSHHLTTLLTTLCCELTHDMGSPEVVVAALQGTQLLLNNSVTHLALKKILPVLKNHIYSPAASIRNAMLSLLQTLQQTRLFKVWDLVSAKDLLLVVEDMKPGMTRQTIVSLLVPLYFPVDENLSGQIQITLDMIRQFDTVHRAFFLDAYQHVGLDASLKLLLGLLKLVTKCIKTESKGSKGSEKDSKLNISSEDTTKVAQVLEICSVLILASHKDLMRHREYADKVCQTIVPLLPKILVEFTTDPVCNEALSIIISNLPKDGLQVMKKHCYKMCKGSSTNSYVMTAACLAMSRAGEGDRILTYLSDAINSKLESVLKSRVVDPNAATLVEKSSEDSTKVIQTVSNIIASSEFPTFLENSQVDELYCTLLATADIIPRFNTSKRGLTLRSDQFKFLVDCLALATRLSIHIGGVEDLIQIAECVWNVLENTRSGNNNRSLILNEVLSATVEGFQVLQYSSRLLTLLFHLTSSLASSELSVHRLSVCKYLYRAGSFLTHNPSPEIDVKSLAVRVFRTAVAAQSVRDLQDVHCLLLDIGVSVQKQELADSRGKPWTGIVDDLLQIILENLALVEEEITSRTDLPAFLQVILECINVSDSFSCTILLALQTAAVQHDSVNQFVKLINS